MDNIARPLTTSHGLSAGSGNDNKQDGLLEKFYHLKQKHQEGAYPTLDERKLKLQKMITLLQVHGEEIAAAVSQDFSYRATTETLFLEVFPAINAIRYCLKHLKGWMKPRSRHISWMLRPAYAYLFPQPLGVVGVMVPWNYPVFLSLIPVAYALASGNKVMLKTSELSPHLGLLLVKLFHQAGIAEDDLAIINGDVSVSKQFSSLPFGHLMFTGSTRVGREVMKAASENLTPVTLELGGKSPAIISQGVNESLLARLFLGKCLNAGQTCIAPDYLLIADGQENNIKKAFQSFVANHYPDLLNNKDYTSIVSLQHKERLLALLKDAKSKGAEIVTIGATSIDADSQKLPLSLVFNVTDDMHIMQEEIFGPILPVKTYHTFHDALDYIGQKPHPLALYYFGHDTHEIGVLKRYSLSGALSVNETIVHIAVDDLPFGGVGQSGMGSTHGKEGFDMFSKLRPVFVQRRFTLRSWFYPPYGKRVRWLLKFLGGIKLTS